MIIQPPSTHPTAHARSLPRNRIAYELRTHLVPLLGVTGAVGLALGLAGGGVGSDLGVMSTAIGGTFLLSAILCANLRREPIRLMLAILLIDSGIALYQAGIYKAVGDEALFARVGPMLICGLVLLSNNQKQAPGPARTLVRVWLACNLPTVIAGCLYDHLTLADSATLSALAVVYPILVYSKFDELMRRGVHRETFEDIITVSLLVLTAVPTMLMPIELHLRQTDSFAALQFGGRSYATISATMLMWPIIAASLMRWQPVPRYLSIALLLMVFFTSFSRGALLIGATFVVGLLSIRLIFRTQRKDNVMSSVAIAAALLVGGLIVFLGDFIEPGTKFWQSRLNVSTSASSGVSVDYDAFWDTGRDSIWQSAFLVFGDAPLTGQGIGTTKAQLISATDGLLGFGTMHNLSLTVLVERGLAGCIGLFALLGTIAHGISRLPRGRRILPAFTFLLFLAHSHVTGAELCYYGARSTNVSITIYLFALVAWLSPHWVSQSASNSSMKQEAR